MAFKDIITLSYFSNTILEYFIAAGIFIVALIILKIFKFVIIKKLESFSKKTKTDIDDAIIEAIDTIGWPFYVVLALFLALQSLLISEIMNNIIYYAFLIVMTFYAGKIVSHIISFSSRKVSKSGQKSGIISLISVSAQVILWMLVVILILDNLGFDVATLLAGVGIGGIAIAFALQNVLSDIFAAVSIHFDKPFEDGDFIIIGSDMGVVERIGIKSTRIRTLQGQELVVSNQELTSTRVNNYKKMEKRRVVFTFGVTYDTSTAQLKKIPDMVKKVIEKIETAEVDRVHFKNFDDFALTFEAVYYVATGDYNQYMDDQQEINLGIKQSFEKAKIEMAFPTQTIYVKK